jgi:predicted MPP superfamily phosphohydrolase
MRRLSFLLRFALLGALLHVYVGLRLLPALPLPTGGKWLGAVLLLLLCAVQPLGMMSRNFTRQPLGDRVAWAAFLAMGFFSSLFVFTLLRDAAYVLAVFGYWVAGLAGPARALEGPTAMAVIAIALYISAVGLYNARRLARVVEIDIPIAGLPAALHGFTVVQISDLHVGPTIKKRYIERIVAAVNALQADVVAVTGDLVDGSPEHLRADIAPLAALQARDGAYMVTGNHEYYAGAKRWRGEFEGVGLKLLDNRHVVLERGGARLLLAGVNDWSAGGFDAQGASDPLAAAAGGPSDVVRVLLAHQPRSAVLAEQAGFQLQLSGHTHGGQFFPWMFFVRMQQPFRAGLHRLGKLWVYTSRGTGYWGPPLRFCAPSEITRLRLVPA